MDQTHFVKNNSQIVMNDNPEVTNVSTQQTKDYIDEKIAEKFSERNISEIRGFFSQYLNFYLKLYGM